MRLTQCFHFFSSTIMAFEECLNYLVIVIIFFFFRLLAPHLLIPRKRLKIPTLKWKNLFSIIRCSLPSSLLAYFPLRILQPDSVWKMN